MRDLVLAGALVLAMPAMAGAQDAPVEDVEAGTLLEQRSADVAAVILGQREPEEVFSPAFLASVPPAQLAQIGTQLGAQFGPLIGVEAVIPANEYAGTIKLRFERAIGSGQINIDAAAPNLVSGLLLQSFEPIDDSKAKIEADLEALPGDVTVLFTALEDGAAPIIARNAEQQMPLGSTFKLYVLSALARSIEQGERNWSDIADLNVKSFPSGMLQNWPQGAPITLQTLASLMISISDNTATDQLIRILGREAIESEVLRIGHSDPAGLKPFLTTLELFALKGDLESGRRFADADEAGQRAILAEIRERTGWTTDSIAGPTFSQPTMVDTLEWFASAQDVAKLMDTLAGYDDASVRHIMAISTAMPASVEAKWSYIGYKGGSEPGVLNLSWLLANKQNVPHVLTMSWRNSQAVVAKSTFDLLAQRIVALAD